MSSSRGRGTTRRAVLGAALLTGVGVAAGGTLAAPRLPAPRSDAAPGFVAVADTGFSLDGRAFPVTGTNTHYLGWASRAEVDDALGRARALGLNVVRTFIGCQVGSLRSRSPRTVWDRLSDADSSNLGVHGTYVAYWDDSAGTWAWNDSTVNGLGRWDYVIATATRLGIRLLPVLLDYWPFVGGAQQVMTWLEPGYRGVDAEDSKTSFFAEDTARAFYRDWTAHVLGRVNTLTGHRYADEPAIFGWDLMNEPQIDNSVTGPGGLPLALDWLTAMSAHVRSLDPNHLITCGMEGFYDRGGIVDPSDVLGVPDLDFGCWHLYPELYGLDLEQVPLLIARHGASALAAGKPVLLEEFGYSDTHRDQPQVYRSWLEDLAVSPNRGGWTFWRLVGRVRLRPTRAFPAAEYDAMNGFPPDTGGGFDLIGAVSRASVTQIATVHVVKRAAARERS